MNQKLFQRFMNEIEDEFLEEAYKKTAAGPSPSRLPADGASFGRNRRVWLRRSIAAAACLCLVAAGIAAGGKLRNDGKPATMEDIAELGFRLVLPEEAEAATYEVLEGGTAVEADFTLKGETYTCRAEKTSEAEVPAGEDGWVAWYTEEEEVLYVLAGGGEAGDAALLTTARQIMNRLGYDMDVAPQNAKNIMYITFALDPGDGTEALETAETSFTVDGIRYAYRTAGTGQVVLQDISGMEDGKYENSSSLELGWCAAEAFWTEGGAGKLIWLDLAPGLVYSLTMDRGASKDALTEMAETLYTPAQGDVG
ncbi:MAG: hypothetical protein PUE84_09450 [Firmicutes bacterium]|nr:hypothetical protein [Bacillota bacterium]